MVLRLLLFGLVGLSAIASRPPLSNCGLIFALLLRAGAEL